MRIIYTIMLLNVCLNGDNFGHSDDRLSQSGEKATTVVPVMNGHPRDQAKVSVHFRWLLKFLLLLLLLIRGNLTLKCVGRGIDNVAVQGR